MKQTLIKRCSFILFTLMSIITYAQNVSSKIKITGTVTDNTGLLLPGVNVTEKSSKNSVTTGFDGKYEISVRPGATLVFSFIGMKKIEIPLNGRTNLDAKLQEDSNILDDIVVVAYGKQKRNNITGAIATIKPQELEALPVTNLAEALRGQIPGLTVNGNGASRPGTTAEVSIRQNFGFSTDGSNTIPLIVIDDMVQIDPTTGRSTMDMLNRLDPSEIESITVLKDGSAAIYGSRAAQGAIVVKTKRGKEGKTKLSYSSQFAINDAISHGKTMSAYESGLYNNRYLKSISPTIVDGLLYSADELEEMKTLNYNWLDEAWKPATQQKHTLNVSGGNDKATYFAGITYLNQGANLGSQDYKRWNFRTGVDAKVTKDLDLSFSVSGNTGDIEKSFTKGSSSVKNGYAGSGSEQADYALLLHMPKFIPITLTKDGVEYYTSPFPSSQSNLSNTQNTNSSISGWNYFATLNNGSKSINNDFTYNVNGALTYKVPFIKGLSLKGSYAKSQTSSRSEQIALPYTLARISNFYTAGNHLASEATDSEILIAENTKGARVQYDNNISKNMQANFFASYTRTFGDHDIDAMVGVERSENEYSQTRLLYDTTTTKDYLGTSASAGTLNSGNSYAVKGEGGTLSYLGRLNYSYKSKYLLQFVFREDASTKFAPENYWGFFPSVQAGWTMSKEDWFRDNISWINYLKFRYSVGKTGRDNIKAWRWATYYDLATDKGEQFGSSGGTLAGAINPRQNPNRNAGWDTDWKQDFGIDFNLFNNRLQITADYYFDKNTDMLIPLSNQVGVPFSVGGSFAEENYAAVNAWGTEFSINWSDKLKGDFSYNVGVNFSFNDNETTKYPNPGYTLESTNTRREGYSTYNPVWGFKVWKGTSTGDGILRTDEDVHNYWQYLTDQAAASGIQGAAPKYFDITTEAALMTKKGTLAYQDLGGALDAATGLQNGPDGKIVKNEDYGKLAKNNRTYGFTTNLGAKFKKFYINSQISTSWGGYNSIDLVSDYTKAATNSSEVTYARESFWKDMYGYDNLNGKYPTTAFRDYTTGVPSDFWEVSNFRCVVRNLTAGFEIPKKVLDTINVEKVTIGITGYNLWDLYNPYPDHYRNMYDNSTAGYPTLRTWTLNLNVTF